MWSRFTVVNLQNICRLTSRVNGDRPSQWEMANFDPSQNRNPWADCNKNPHNWLRPREDTLNQIWYKSIHWGLLGIWVKYNVFVPFLFIYTFFLRLAYRSTGWWIFTRDSSLEVKSRKDVPFWGLNDVPLNFGIKLPKNQIFGAWTGLSSLNDKIFKPL